MDLEELELARTYVPHLRYDWEEPFSLKGIGYTIYRGTAKSPSCRRTIEVSEGRTAIEYAFYYDFDIQHLYDLEHAFVYIDGAGAVTGVESSFHGKFLNSYIDGVLEFEGSHPVLYVQPGKHALLPSPAYFQLALDRDATCSRKAGEDGFLIAPMFEGRLFTNEELDRKVKTFIRENYSFAPSWKFTDRSPDGRGTEELLIPYGELDEMIVRRLRTWSGEIAKLQDAVSDRE